MVISTWIQVPALTVKGMENVESDGGIQTAGMDALGTLHSHELAQEI